MTPCLGFFIIINFFRNCFTLALDGKINIEFNIEKPHTSGLKDWIGLYEYGIQYLFLLVKLNFFF